MFGLRNRWPLQGAVSQSPCRSPSIGLSSSFVKRGRANGCESAAERMRREEDADDETINQAIDAFLDRIKAP